MATPMRTPQPPAALAQGSSPSPRTRSTSPLATFVPTPAPSAVSLSEINASFANLSFGSKTPERSQPAVDDALAWDRQLYAAAEARWACEAAPPQPAVVGLPDPRWC